jgi:cyclic-di-AMP phosphodiesterase PgpH
MPNGKERPPSRLNARRLLILFLFALSLTVFAGLKSPFWPTKYQYGDIATRSVKSPVNLPVPSSYRVIKKGEIIVREGERITEEQVKELALLKEATRRGSLLPEHSLMLFVLLFLSVTVIYEYGLRNIKKFVLSEKDLIFCGVFTTFTVMLAKTSGLIFDYYVPEHAGDLLYLVPVFMFGMVLRIVLFSEAAILFAMVFSLAMGFAFGTSLPVLVYTFLGTILASYFSGKCETRNTVLKAGLYTASLMALVVLALNAFSGNGLAGAPMLVAFVFLNGIASSFIALGLLPVIEYAFDYTTDIKLLELANFEHPLLEQMMINAPGTYHHSIVVGNLAKAAAENIGANPLLARVSAYYHDVGKLKMPHYFIENRPGTEDVHQSLTPSMSALIILAHVKEGAEMANDYRLGRKITEIITQHHGTSLVSFFYGKAKELEDPKLHVIQEKDFRYPGPKPQTKETGLIMLADAVEAASRTLDDPTTKRIETHVQNVIENIFLDGQLDECELTLKDLHAIQRSFTTILIGIFHQRIDYPERILHGTTDKKLTKIPEDQRKVDKRNHRRFADIFKAAG